MHAAIMPVKEPSYSLTAPTTLGAVLPESYQAAVQVAQQQPVRVAPPAAPATDTYKPKYKTAKFTVPSRQALLNRPYAQRHKDVPVSSNRQMGPCVCCKCITTPLWRKGRQGKPLCNACGVRWLKYGVACIRCEYVPRKREAEKAKCPRCESPFVGESGTAVKARKPSPVKRPSDRPVFHAEAYQPASSTQQSSTQPRPTGAAQMKPTKKSYTSKTGSGKQEKKASKHRDHKQLLSHPQYTAVHPQHHLQQHSPDTTPPPTAESRDPNWQLYQYHQQQQHAPRTSMAPTQTSTAVPYAVAYSQPMYHHPGAPAPGPVQHHQYYLPQTSQQPHYHHQQQAPQATTGGAPPQHQYHSYPQQPTAYMQPQHAHAYYPTQQPQQPVAYPHPQAHYVTQQQQHQQPVMVQQQFVSHQAPVSPSQQSTTSSIDRAQSWKAIHDICEAERKQLHMKA